MKKQVYHVCIVLSALMSGSCANSGGAIAREEKCVHVIVAAPVERFAEIKCFGSLTFGSKIDIVSPQDARIVKMLYREGDMVSAGSLVAILDNTQISLAVGVARNALAQAEAAVRLAEARLVEGAQTAEARIIGLDKSRLEIEQARRELTENMRKQTDQESLCNAGGVNEEAVRAGRFAIEAAGQRIGLMVKELEMQCVGLRDEDIIDAGVVPAIQPEARQLQLVQLAVRGLAAERDGAVARLDAARKELASASWSLSELRIASPMDGVVGARYVEPGQRVKREEALCTVIDAGSLFAVVPVPESEAASMTPGMKATITVDAVDGVYEGVIDMISPLADSRSASCTARIALLKPARALRPGMFARVSVRNGTADRIIVVPAGSLTEIDGDSGRLFVVVNQCLAERRVRLGEPVDDGWIVAQGIAGGDVVVDVPGADMKAGDHVSIISP